MSNISPQIIIIASTTAVLAATVAYFYQKSRRNAIPSRWKAIGKVTKLIIYPLKSGRRVELERAECTDYGLRTFGKDGQLFPLRDRSFVIYGANNNEFKTARTYPKTLLIEISSSGKETVTFNAPGMQQLSIKVPKFEQINTTEIILFKEKVRTVDCGEEAAKWFSHYILEKDGELRLGYCDIGERRTVPNEFQKIYPYFNKNATGLYSDATSYLFINQASVNELIERIGNSSVTANNFRPNILFEGNAEAYSEDKWDWIKVGDVIFRNVKPCTRCILTTINPETGIREESREPLKTLEKYRRLQDVLSISLEGKSPVMGIHTAIYKNGTVKIGETVYIGER